MNPKNLVFKNELDDDPNFDIQEKNIADFIGWKWIKRFTENQ